jgi:hypothetical protein
MIISYLKTAFNSILNGSAHLLPSSIKPHNIWTLIHTKENLKRNLLNTYRPATRSLITTKEDTPTTSLESNELQHSSVKSWLMPGKGSNVRNPMVSLRWTGNNTRPF